MSDSKRFFLMRICDLEIHDTAGRGLFSAAQEHNQGRNALMPLIPGQEKSITEHRQQQAFQA